MSEDYYYYQLNMKNIGEYASGQSRLTVNQFAQRSGVRSLHSVSVGA